MSNVPIFYYQNFRLSLRFSDHTKKKTTQFDEKKVFLPDFFLKYGRNILCYLHSNRLSLFWFGTVRTKETKNLF